MSFVRLKPGSTTLPILRNHLATPQVRPLHLQGLTDHWPASSLWTLNDGLASIRESVGDEREVTVELGKRGRGYLDPEYQRISMGFGTSPSLYLDIVPIPLDIDHPRSTLVPFITLQHHADLLSQDADTFRFIPRRIHT